MIVPPWFWVSVAFVLGICIGSFLNVVIYRMPIGKSVAEPQWSFCPRCPNDPPGSSRLAAIDLIPLLSYLALGGRCRRCRQPISSRYFWVELLTGLLFVALWLHFASDPATAVALLLFGAVLVPVFFIDLDTFQINDSLNVLAFAIALGRDLWGIALHEPGHALLMGCVPRSVLGAFIGVLIFGAVRVAGWLWKRLEAMGLGDVLLARAMGAMLISITPPEHNPLFLFPIWVVLACLSGLIVGPVMILIRKRCEPGPSAAEQDAAGDDEEDAGTFALQLRDIGYCLALGDVADYFRGLRHRQAPVDAETDDWAPAATAIPFGPFMIIGFLVTVFGGVWITARYLAWALPGPILPPEP